MNRTDKTATMVRMNNDNENDLDAKLRYGNPDSPTVGSTFTKSLTTNLTKSPKTGISRRKWSPGQATLIRRKKVEGETTVDDSFDGLNLSLDNDADDEASDKDYLQRSLDEIEKSEKRSGSRPTTPTSISITNDYPIKLKPKYSNMGERNRDLPPSSNATNRRRTPRKSKSTGACRPMRSTSMGSDSVGSELRSNSSSPSRRRTSRSRSKGHRRKMKSKSMDVSLKPQINQKDLPIEIQQKLYRVTDPDISIKKKVELELEFMKGTPEERRIYLEFRNHFDRQQVFVTKAMEEQQKQDKIEADAREEGRKEAAFLKTVELKRQKERQKEEEAKERERKAIEKAQMHSVKTIANAMTEIKSAALEAATVSVARNQYEKKRYEDERKQLVEDFRKNEGKNMTDVQRELKEAIIEQEDPEEKRMRLRGYKPYRRN